MKSVKNWPTLEEISGPYFPVSVFSPNAVKYGLEKALYLDTFHAVSRANISRILRIKNAKIWGYYFYMNTNI